MKRKRTTSRITSVTNISVRSVKRKELVMTIAALLEPIRHQPGCRDYGFFEVIGEKNSFVLIGEWESISDWDRHMLSEHFAVLLGSLELLGDEKRPQFELLSPYGRGDESLYAGLEKHDSPGRTHI